MLLCVLVRDALIWSNPRSSWYARLGLKVVQCRPRLIVLNDRRTPRLSGCFTYGYKVLMIARSLSIRYSRMNCAASQLPVGFNFTIADQKCMQKIGRTIKLKW